MLAVLLAPLYLAVNGYLLWRLLGWLGAMGVQSRPLHIVVSLGFGVACTSVLTGFLTGWRPLRILGNVWLGVLLYTILFLLLAEGLRLILPKRFRTRKNRVRTGAAVMLAVCIVSGYGFFHGRDVQVTRWQAAVDKPCAAGDALNVVLVSDLHLGANLGSRQLEQIAALINEQQPDLVCLAGDIFDNDYDALDDPDAIRAAFASLQSKYGVYACWGNHDVQEKLLGGFSFRGSPLNDPRMAQLLANAGVTLLSDEALEVDGAFYLVGRKDAKRPADGAARLPAAALTAGLDADKPILFLDHQPRALAEAAAAGADVVLSGHTHGGQLFPANLFINFMWPNAWSCRSVDGVTSVVTAGAGMWGPAMRVGADAEIVQLTLQFTPSGE